MANSIWYRQGLTVIEDFLQRCRTIFGAQVEELDFSAPDAADIINGWVSDNTQNKIKEIVDKPIDPAIVMFLINAIYFKGTWTYEFDPQDTKDDQFTRADGTQASCRMMEQEADLPYMANDLFQAADLPYGDGLFSMTVLLPKQDVHVDSLVALLTPENWQSWMGNLDSAAVLLQLPKFTLEYELEMKEVLTALGMGLAFHESVVDFTRMIEPAGLIWIAKVKHKTFVRVDEEGTEAAAITSVEMVFESVGSGLISMRLDRPFIFVIRERTSGTLLFMGKIVEPQWEEG